MSISALRRKLDRHGFGLRARGGYFHIWEHTTHGLVHDGGADGFPLDFGEAVQLADQLCS